MANILLAEVRNNCAAAEIRLAGTVLGKEPAEGKRCCCRGKCHLQCLPNATPELIDVSRKCVQLKKDRLQAVQDKDLVSLKKIIAESEKVRQKIFEIVSDL